jgi:hypothetical protein
LNVSIFTGGFWLAASERAVKTAAQALVAMWGVGQTNLLTVDWKQSAAVAGMAALLSLVTSIASSGVGNPGPSLADETIVRHPGADSPEDTDIPPPDMAAIGLAEKPSPPPEDVIA